MLNITRPVLEYNGKRYELELGTIESTFIGIEDHGIFAVGISFDFNGAIQGTGLYGAGKDGEHLGTYVQAILKVAGSYAQWETLKGTQMYAAREGSYGSIKGIISVDQQRHLFFEELNLAS